MATDEKGVDDVVPTVTLARLYEKQGLLKDAAAVYRRLLSEDPGQKTLEDSLKDIERRLGGQGRRVGYADSETVLSRLERWQQVVCAKKKALGLPADDRARVFVVVGPDSGSAAEGENDRQDATWEEIELCVRQAAEAVGIFADFNHAVDEEALIRRLGEVTLGYEVLIIAPGQPGSIGSETRHALAALDIPIIEVHPLNAFRGGLGCESGIGDITTAHLAGFGKEGYAMAVRAAAEMARQIPSDRA